MCTLSMHIHTLTFFFCSPTLPTEILHSLHRGASPTESQPLRITLSQPVCSSTYLMLHTIPPAVYHPSWPGKISLKKGLGHTESADTLSFPETTLIFPGCVPRQTGVWKASCIIPCSTCQNKSHELSPTAFLGFSASSGKDGLIVKQHFSDGPSCFCGAESEGTLRTEAIFIHPPVMTGWGSLPLPWMTEELRTPSHLRSSHIPALNFLRFKRQSYSRCYVNADCSLSALPTQRASLFVLTAARRLLAWQLAPAFPRFCRCSHSLPRQHLLSSSCCPNCSKKMALQTYP